MIAYSPYLKTLYDQPDEVGFLGRGSHYSVLRAICWHDVDLKPLPTAQFLDFAIVWDQDHDSRIIPVIELMLVQGLMSPVKFIGERKGGLTILFDDIAWASWSERARQKYQGQIEKIVGASSDPWCVTVDAVTGSSHGIINDQSRKVGLFLANIDMLWRLGLKTIHADDLVKSEAPEFELVPAP